MQILDIVFIRKSARVLAFGIFSILLKGIIWLYDLFEIIALSNPFEEELIKGFCNRIELILGLFMVFRLSISAIQYVINPDTMSDSKKGAGNIVKKVLITVILLGSVHYLFSEARNIQSILLDEDDSFIKKVVLPQSSYDTTSDSDGISWTIFESFYIPVNAANDCQVDYIKNKENSFADSMDYASDKCITERTNGEEWDIDFQWLFGIGCAGFVLWVILIYTIQLGLRAFQLAFLEIISPIPIMMYINPDGEEALKKWAKQCVSTFLDVFIRVAILYFIIWSFDVLRNDSNIFDTKIVAIIFLIGLMMFAQRLPNLLKELFPSIGGGLDIGFKMSKEGKGFASFLGGAAIGAAAGGIAGAITGEGVKGRIGGFAKGTMGGLYNGAMPKKKLGDAAAIKDFNTRRKDIRQNRVEQNDRAKLLKRGEDIAKKYRNSEGKLTENAFRNNKFKESWNKVNEAKGKLKEADYAKDIAYEAWRKNQTAENRTIYENAISKYKAADAELNEMKKNHENNRKIYVEDARSEDAYEYYDHLNPYISNSTNQQNDTGNDNDLNPIISGTPTDNHSGTIIDNSTPSHPRNDTNEQQTGVTENAQYQQLINRYNNASSGPERDQIRREIDEFEKRH